MSKKRIEERITISEVQNDIREIAGVSSQESLKELLAVDEFEEIHVPTEIIAMRRHLERVGKRKTIIFLPPRIQETYRILPKGVTKVVEVGGGAYSEYDSVSMAGKSVSDVLIEGNDAKATFKTTKSVSHATTHIAGQEIYGVETIEGEKVVASEHDEGNTFKYNQVIDGNETKTKVVRKGSKSKEIVEDGLNVDDAIEIQELP